MIITLQESVNRSGDLVIFRAQIGCGLGRWCGSAAQVAGVEVDVELDIDSEVDWSAIDVTSDEVLASMRVCNQVTEISAPVVDLNEDNVVTLRLGDGEVRLETVGSPPMRSPRGIRVCVPVLEIYPTNA